MLKSSVSASCGKLSSNGSAKALHSCRSWQDNMTSTALHRISLHSRQKSHICNLWLVHPSDILFGQWARALIAACAGLAIQGQRCMHIGVNVPSVNSRCRIPGPSHASACKLASCSSCGSLSHMQWQQRVETVGGEVPCPVGEICVPIKVSEP